MNRIFWSACIFAVFAQIQAQECDNPCTTPNQTPCRLPEINDVKSPGDKILEFTDASNIKSATKGADKNEKYVEVKLENDNFALELSSEFAKIDENEQQDSNSISLNIEITYICTDDSSVKKTYYQKVIDTNNYSPAFLKPNYEYVLPMPFPSGYVINEDDLIAATDLDFSNTNIIFTVDADFEVIPKRTEGKTYFAALKTANQLDFEDEKTYTITATDTGDPTKSTNVPLIIKRNPVSSSPSAPTFQEPLYQAKYIVNQDGHGSLLPMPEIIIEEDSVSKLSLSDSTYFNIERKDNKVIVSLKGDISDEDLENKSFILTVLTASEPSKPTLKGNAVIIVELPKPEPGTTTACPDITTASTEATTCPVCPETTTPMTCPEITTTPCPEVTTCPVCPETTTPMTCPEITTTPCPEATTCPDCPSVTCPPCTTIGPDQCPTCPTCPDVTTTPDPGNVTTTSTQRPDQCPTCPTCPDVTTTPEPGTDVTTQCPICPTTTTTPQGPDVTTQCPECPNVCSTTPTPIPEITFPQDSYTFYLPPVMSGPVAFAVTASINPIQDFIYNITQSDGQNISSDIQFDRRTGTITFTKLLSQPQMAFKVTANVGEIKAETTVTIIQTSCDGDVELPEYSLIVNNELFENTKYDKIEVLSKPLSADYNYKIVTQEPEGFFTINAETGVLSLTKELDRETNDKHLLRVKLEKVTKKSTNLNSLLPSQFKTDSGICGLENIGIGHSETMIIFEVQDENDNAPVFDETSYTFGYPVKELLDIISPQYVGQVYATDADNGINAEIKYSLPEDAKFYIHPNTGVIYSNNDLKTTQKFTVTAADQNGQEDGKKTNVEVSIHFLNRKNLVVMDRIGMVLENLEEELNTLSNNIGITIKHLSAWTFPTQTRHKRDTNEKDGNKFNTKIIVYGFDKSGNLVASSDLENKIESSSQFTAKEFEDFYEEVTDCKLEDCEDCTSDDCKDVCEDVCAEEGEDCGGLIAGVIVLAILLVVVIVAVIAFYFLKLRKRDNDNTKLVYGEEPPAYHKNSDLKQVVLDEPTQRRPTGFIFNPPPPEDEDEDDDEKYEAVDKPKEEVTKPEYNNVHVYDEVSKENEKEVKPAAARERKKSVSFNNMVEAFDKDDDLESHKDDNEETASVKGTSM